MTNKIKDIGKTIGALLYPEVCPLCGRIIQYNKEKVCDDCKIKLEPIKSPTCLKCGKEVEKESDEYCRDCNESGRSYVKGFPAMNYNEDMAKCLSEFKYHNMRCFGDFLADIIVKYSGKDILLANPQIIVPVPVHKSKLRTRGYNQANILADELGKRLNIPVEKDLIFRRANTTPQKQLSNKEREENLKKAFISSKKIVNYKRALIVDDIYTSGATIEACTKVLHNMGIRDIYYTSVCVGKGY